MVVRPVTTMQPHQKKNRAEVTGSCSSQWFIHFPVSFIGHIFSHPLHFVCFGNTCYFVLKIPMPCALQLCPWGGALIFFIFCTLSLKVHFRHFLFYTKFQIFLSTACTSAWAMTINLCPCKSCWKICFYVGLHYTELSCLNLNLTPHPVFIKVMA